MKRSLHVVLLGTMLGAAPIAAQERNLECVETRQGEQFDLKCRPEGTPSPEPEPTPPSCPCGSREDGRECKPCPPPDPEPSPEPGPGPEPEPDPGDGCVLEWTEQHGYRGCRWSQTCEKAEDGGPNVCVDPKWSAVSCAALPDDPPTLARSGPGCGVKGGTGTGKIIVTNLADSGQGSLRWAFGQVGQERRIIECSPQLVGDIVLKTPLLIEKPFLTWDFSMCDVAVVPEKRFIGTVVFRGGAHQILVHSVRHVGQFTVPHLRTQNAGMASLDGYDPTVTRYAWDSDWDSTPPLMRMAVRDILFDRVTAIRCEDDCFTAWEGVHRFTNSRFLAQGYHPTVTGSSGWPRPPFRQRQEIAYMYGIWYFSGERTAKFREATHNWLYGRNLVYNWAFIKTAPSPEYPQVEISAAHGLNLSDDAPDEIDLGWVLNNCFISGPDSKLRNDQGQVIEDHWNWGVVVGNHAYCEDPAGCGGSGSQDIGCCNPKLKKTRFVFDGNEGHFREGRTNPPDYVPKQALPFPFDAQRSWTQVLAEAGVVKRRPNEQAEIDKIIARLSECVIPQ